jgi:hypothetical protein
MCGDHNPCFLVTTPKRVLTPPQHEFLGAKNRLMLSALLLPALRERFPDRGLVEGVRPEAVAFFPGLHSGIRGVSIYDDGNELTVSIDELTHSHFDEHDSSLGKKVREQWIVHAVIEFLERLFADEVAVWGQINVGGGLFIPDDSVRHAPEGVPEYFWSGPRTQASREHKD